MIVGCFGWTPHCTVLLSSLSQTSHPVVQECQLKSDNMHLPLSIIDDFYRGKGKLGKPLHFKGSSFHVSGKITRGQILATAMDFSRLCDGSDMHPTLTSF